MYAEGFQLFKELEYCMYRYGQGHGTGTVKDSLTGGGEFLDSDQYQKASQYLGGSHRIRVQPNTSLLLNCV